MCFRPIHKRDLSTAYAAPPKPSLLKLRGGVLRAPSTNTELFPLVSETRQRKRKRQREEDTDRKLKGKRQRIGLRRPPTPLRNCFCRLYACGYAGLRALHARLRGQLLCPLSYKALKRECNKPRSALHRELFCGPAFNLLHLQYLDTWNWTPL